MNGPAKKGRSAYQVSMKDVAEIAGVSMGTVSNVLKGDRRVSLAMVQRVQAAIRKTGYRTVVPLRTSGKPRKSRYIGVVVPTVQDPNYAAVFTGMDHIFAEHGYMASLSVSAEIQTREQKAIEQFVKQGVEGILIITCQPDANELFHSVFDNGIPLVFIEREPSDKSFPFVEYDCVRQLRSLTLELLDDGYTNPVLVTGPLENSSEAGYLKGFSQAMAERNLPVSPALSHIETNFNKESAFSAMVARLSHTPRADVIISTSIPLLAGARQAVTVLNLDEEPDFISLGEDSWAPVVPAKTRVMRRDAMGMGEAAANLLLDMITNGESDKGRRISINHARFKPEEKPPVRTSARLRNKQRQLRALMLAGAACSAVEALLPAFCKNTGIRVEIEKRTVVEIAALVRDTARRGMYDIVQVDQPWLGEVAEDGLLLKLDDWLDANPAIKNAWLPGVLDAYCRYREHYYAVPYLFGSQLLFYRKDLFSDPTVRSTFRKTHHYDLRAPKNWSEFNQIAAFFTKSLNPDSPVEYGVTLGGQEPNGAVCEFMPRLFAFCGGRFEADSMLALLSSPEAVKALENYTESYRYAAPGSQNNWWDEQAEQFGQGKAAMMILYLGHVSTLADRSKSKVIGKIGYDLLPGGMPMLGGWTLGVNASSQHRDAALDFIAWTCARDLVIPFTLLGGTQPASWVYHNSELCAMYPWLPKAVESFSRSYERNITKVTTSGKIEEREFENILGNAVHKAICGQLGAAEALDHAKRDLTRLIHKSG